MSVVAGLVTVASIVGGAWYLSRMANQTGSNGRPSRAQFEQLQYDVRSTRKRYGLYSWAKDEAPVLISTNDSLDTLSNEASSWLEAQSTDASASRVELGAWDSRLNRVVATFRITWRDTTMPNPL